MKALDKTDLKILKLLQQNARIPMTELVEKVGLSDMSAYRDMLGNILLQLPAAAESRSYVLMEEVKEMPMLNLD